MHSVLESSFKFIVHPENFSDSETQHKKTRTKIFSFQ